MINELAKQKFHPILYQTEMVQAILEGRKTMTRRTVKASFHPDTNSVVRIHPFENVYLPYDKFGRTTGTGIECPYGDISDVLWVRETFNRDPLSKEFYYKANGLEGMPDFYKQCAQANNLKFPKDFEWRPSIFMPKAACRIFLEITDITIERLQDISEEDAIKEGIFFKDYGRTCYHKGMNGNVSICPEPIEHHPQKRGWSHKETSSTDQCLPTAKIAFVNLWQKINSAESWEANPFVWVISFKQIEKPENFILMELQNAQTLKYQNHEKNKISLA